MQKGLLARYIVVEILKELKEKSEGYDSILLKHIKNQKIKNSDINLIQNTVLTSIRYNFEINEIIDIYAKKIKKNSRSYFLLLSAITQIVFLNFKDYAVINSSVEISKNKNFKTYAGFINGFLRNIAKNKKKLLLMKANHSKLPLWFKEKTKKWDTIEKNKFLKTIKNIPDIHLVFKKEKDLDDFNFPSYRTTSHSLVLKKSEKIENLPKYKEGCWWIQDYSSMMPIFLINNLKSKKVLDMCAAPGGKTFQLLNNGSEVLSYEKNEKKINIMKENLKRLKIKNKIINKDSLLINSKNKFDVVVLDAPCSAIGTIRRNPEIFFRNKSPNFAKITNFQYKLLNKAKELINNKGVVIYMVCSFLDIECENQIEKFLNENKNFSIKKFKSSEKNLSKLINDKGYFKTVPVRLNNKFLIDGFFAVQLERND